MLPKRNALFIAALAAFALAFPAVSPAAQAHKPHRLSTVQAKSAMRASAQLDQPRSVAVTGCKRLSRARVVCTVTEYGAHTLVLDEGQPIVGDLTWEVEAVLAHGRVTVR